MTPTPNKDALLASLTAHGHVGASRGITARHLAGRLDCPERHVRKLVSELREEGIAVCGLPRTGYYIAATAEEVEDTCRFLRERALHSLTLESRLRKVPLPELLGQLRIPT